MIYAVICETCGKEIFREVPYGTPANVVFSFPCAACGSMKLTWIRAVDKGNGASMGGKA